MSEGVNYDINAYLRTSGSFNKELGASEDAAHRFASSYQKVGDRMVSVGERIRGNFGATSAAILSAGAGAIGGALVGGLTAATAHGVKMNDTLEQGALGLATMYQQFGVSDSFQENLDLAKAMQVELVKIGDASPGTTEDMMAAYQAMAPGVSGVTQDLERQRALMEKMAVMSWTTAGDYKQMGADVGRIVKGLAGADVAVFSTLQPALEKAFTEVTGKAADADFAQQFNKLARTSGDTALKILETAMAGVGPEVNKAFGESFGGVVASLQSKLTKTAQDFTKPLFDEVRNALVQDWMGDGPFSDAAMGKVREAAFFFGDKMAEGAMKVNDLLLKGVDYAINNYMEIATSLRNAGVLAGKAIQAAIAVGATRYIVGTAIGAAGKALSNGSALIDAAKPVAKWVAGQTKATHASMTRGFLGEGKGMLGAMGKKLASVSVKSGLGGGLISGLGGKEKAFDKGILKFASMAATVGSLATVAGLAVTVLGGLGVVVAGAAAYITSNWDQISGSLISGLQSGAITLQPLIVSLYTFYARLEMVGEAIFGQINATTAAQGMIDLLSGTINVASTGLSYFIKGLSIMVGAFGALKLGMLGVAKVILTVAELGAKIGAVDDSAIAQMQKNYANFSAGVDDTFTTADKLDRAAEKIASAQLGAMDQAKAQEKAKELEKGLADLLSGKGKKDGRDTKPSVKVGKVEIIVPMPDPDPDRIISVFGRKMRSLEERRVEPRPA